MAKGSFTKYVYSQGEGGSKKSKNMSTRVYLSVNQGGGGSKNAENL